MCENESRRKQTHVVVVFGGLLAPLRRLAAHPGQLPRRAASGAVAAWARRVKAVPRKHSCRVRPCRAAPDSRPPAAVSRCTPWSPRLRAQPRLSACGARRCEVLSWGGLVCGITCVGCHDAAAAAARGAREVSRARCWTRAGTRALQVAVTWRRRLDASRLTAPRLSSERDTWRRQRHAVIKCARRPSCASARLRHAAVAQSMHKRRCASTRLEIRAAPLLLPVSEPARRAGAAQRASGWRPACTASRAWLALFPLAHRARPSPPAPARHRDTSAPAVSHARLQRHSLACAGSTVSASAAVGTGASRCSSFSSSSSVRRCASTKNAGVCGESGGGAVASGRSADAARPRSNALLRASIARPGARTTDAQDAVLARRLREGTRAQK